MAVGRGDRHVLQERRRRLFLQRAPVGAVGVQHAGTLCDVLFISDEGAAGAFGGLPDAAVSELV